jgi:hypothetical protein
MGAGSRAGSSEVRIPYQAAGHPIAGAGGRLDSMPRRARALPRWDRVTSELDRLGRCRPERPVLRSLARAAGTRGCRSFSKDVVLGKSLRGGFALQVPCRFSAYRTETESVVPKLFVSSAPWLPGVDRCTRVAIDAHTVFGRSRCAPTGCVCHRGRAPGGRAVARRDSVDRPPHREHCSHRSHCNQRSIESAVSLRIHTVPDSLLRSALP